MSRDVFGEAPKTASEALALPRMNLLAISDIQSALAPAGRQAMRISQLWWVYLIVLATIFLLVALALFIALSRRNAVTELPAPVFAPTETSNRRTSVAVTFCVIATVIILFVLLFWDFFAGRAIYALTSDKEFLHIKVIGHQWWWEVQYQDPTPSNVMTTANEMHVPIGKPVKLELQSNDVIHSFWVPNMHGKKDLIPGHPTVQYFRADKEGTFRGQCAEFCGLQHAHMRLEFVAESSDKYEKWIAAARQNAPAPTSPTQQRGEQVFVSNQCIMCHTIEGTNARATLGPDLTHLGSRSFIAAGAVPNTRGYLAGWIANPQNIKPGVRMPPNPLPSDDLNALVDYLESLK